MKESEKIEMLLQPRYKVINIFPGMNFIGESGFCYNEIFYPEIKHDKLFYNGVDIDSYPHLFRRIPWWEDRELEEMPQYVKLPNFPNGENDFNIVHVDGHFVKHDFTSIGYFGLKYTNGAGTICSMLFPATEEEYNLSHPTQKSTNEK